MADRVLYGRGVCAAALRGVIVVAVARTGGVARGERVVEMPPTVAPAPTSEASEAAGGREAAPSTELSNDPALVVWNRVAAPLGAHGLTPSLRAYLDTGKNVLGGRSTNGGPTVLSALDFNLTLDTEKAFGWRGGTAYLDVQQIAGESPSVDVGDFQDVDVLSTQGVSRTQVAEAWVQQELLPDDRLRVKVGKIDANLTFGYPLNAPEFINSGMVWVQTDNSMPTYPDPAFGALFVAKPIDGFYFGGGAWDGALARGIHTGENGPRTLWHPPADLYYMGETGVTWGGGTLRRDGRFCVGGWYHTADFLRNDSTGGTHAGASGYYVILDQTLWRENPSDKHDAQGIAMFATYDYADPSVMPADHHVAGGVTWTGAIDGRDDDVLGVGVSWLHFDQGAGFGDTGMETAIECFYRFRVTPGFSVKPDLQYVLSPSGRERDALVAIVRIEMQF